MSQELKAGIQTGICKSMFREVTQIFIVGGLDEQNGVCEDKKALTSFSKSSFLGMLQCELTLK